MKFLVLMLFSGSIFASCHDMLIPGYKYPDWWNASNPYYWDQIQEGSPLPQGRERMVIINPGDGVGPAVNPDYVAVAENMRAAGLLVIGYISTQYGARPAAEVKDEMVKHDQWYGVDGIFLDESPTAASMLPYYQDLISYYTSLSPGSDIVLNPGQYPDEGYLNLDAGQDGSAIIVVVFEGSAEKHANTTAPEWVHDYPDWWFSQMVYETSNEQMDEVLNHSQEMNAGWVFVTDDVFADNPWDTLPSYWSNLVVETMADCL